MAAETWDLHQQAITDTGGQLVVKRTFFEVQDIQPEGLRPRACSDPALFQRADSDQELTKLDAHKMDFDDQNVEFEMAGLSDSETDQESPEEESAVPRLGRRQTAKLLCYDHIEDKEPTGAPEAYSVGQATQKDIDRLLYENARLAEENRLLREDARLAMETQPQECSAARVLPQPRDATAQDAPKQALERLPRRVPERKAATGKTESSVVPEQRVQAKESFVPPQRRNSLPLQPGSTAKQDNSPAQPLLLSESTLTQKYASAPAAQSTSSQSAASMAKRVPVQLSLAIGPVGPKAQLQARGQPQAQLQVLPQAPQRAGPSLQVPGPVPSEAGAVAAGSVCAASAAAKVAAKAKDTCDEVPINERTTVMLRNLPNNYSRSMLLTMLNNEGFNGKYDFVYLPIDFKSCACLGYAFVNLVDPCWVHPFWQKFDGYSQWVLPSRKVCAVSWSGPHQGFEAHVERYKSSPVMHPSVPDEYKPVVFKDSVRIDFPKSTRAPRAPRVRKQGAMGKARGQPASATSG